MTVRFPGRSKGLLVVAEIMVFASGLAGVLGFASPTILDSGLAGKAISFVLAIGALLGVVARYSDVDEVLVVALRIQAGAYFAWAINALWYGLGFSYSESGNTNAQSVLNILALSAFSMTLAHALVAGAKQEREALLGLRESLLSNDEDEDRGSD